MLEYRTQRPYLYLKYNYELVAVVARNLAKLTRLAHTNHHDITTIHPKVYATPARFYYYSFNKVEKNVIHEQIKVQYIRVVNGGRRSHEKQTFIGRMIKTLRLVEPNCSYKRVRNIQLYCSMSTLKHPKIKEI